MRNFTEIHGAADLRDREGGHDADFDTDVFIVGTGPTGATAALALATYGVRTTFISQWSWLANTPRAHITNQRAMEVTRDLGVEEQVLQDAVPWEWMGDTQFATALVGEEIARFPSWGVGDERSGDYRLGSPCTMVDIPQTYMEPILVRNAAERGAKVMFSTRYLGHTQDEHGVTVRLLDRTTDHEYTLRAKYLFGADGAKSKVVEELDLELVGELARAGTVYVQFKADLTHHMAHRPAIMNWIMNPAASFGEIGMATLRCIRPWNEWIVGWGFDMSKGDPDVSEEHLLSQIRTLVGLEDLEPEITGVSTWFVNQQYATSMSKGRVFAGGDAVHRHPPSSGLGSNTCMQDAHNIAWKLAYMTKGWAGPRLGETYQDERVPVAKQIVARANQSRKDYAGLQKVFDTTDPAGSDERKAEYGLERLREPSIEGVERRTDLYHALQIKHYEFNAQGVEMNQRYESTAVVQDESTEEVFTQDRDLYLNATTRPGAKVPHTWLVDAGGRRVSTLDITGKGRFTLLTGISGTAWEDAAATLDLPYLDVIRIGAGEINDFYQGWFKHRETDEAGAVLVRPDGVVGWRHKAAVWDATEAKDSLGAALSTILDTHIS